MTTIIHVANSWDDKWDKITLCGCNTASIRLPFIMHKMYVEDQILQALKVRGVGGNTPDPDTRWCKRCLAALKNHTVKLDKDQQFVLDVMLGKRSTLERLVK